MSNGVNKLKYYTKMGLKRQINLIKYVSDPSHVLRKYVFDPSHVLEVEDLQVKEDLSMKVQPITLEDCQTK